jgi:hypothetical protein
VIVIAVTQIVFLYTDTGNKRLRLIVVLLQFSAVTSISNWIHQLGIYNLTYFAWYRNLLIFVPIVNTIMTYVVTCNALWIILRRFVITNQQSAHVLHAIQHVSNKFYYWCQAKVTKVTNYIMHTRLWILIAWIVSFLIDMTVEGISPLTSRLSAMMLRIDCSHISCPRVLCPRVLFPRFPHSYLAYLRRIGCTGLTVQGYTAEIVGVNLFHDVTGNRHRNIVIPTHLPYGRANFHNLNPLAASFHVILRNDTDDAVHVHVYVDRVKRIDVYRIQPMNSIRIAVVAGITIDFRFVPVYNDPLQSVTPNMDDYPAWCKSIQHVDIPVADLDVDDNVIGPTMMFEDHTSTVFIGFTSV